MACWGDNEHGQVGLPEDARGTEGTGPIVVLDAADRVVAGAFHTCASQGELVTCWGDNRFANVAPGAEREVHVYAETSVSEPVRELALGRTFTCALLSTKLVCWGEGLGHADAPELRAVELDPEVNVGEATQIIAGAGHACLLDGTGQAWCWGDDRYGQVGDGGEADDLIAAPVRIEGGPYVQLSAGLGHTCALTEDGVVECWGANQVRAAGQIELGGQHDAGE